MFTQKYKMADCVIEVNTLYENVHQLCRDYASEEPVDFSVTVTEEDILREKQRSDSEYAYEGLPAPQFSAGQLEETAVYRKIAEIMPDYGAFVFHGSCIAVDGQGYLFTAKSGTGKSTHTRLWRELFGSRAVMVNDDKPLLRVAENGVTVYGTPYNGKHRLGENITVPLRAVCILERAAENKIVRISGTAAYPMLLQQVYRPQNRDAMQKTLALIDCMAAKTALFRLGCNMDISAAETAFDAMKP